MNQVILMGRLTRDPEIRFANRNGEQFAVANGTIAVNRPGKDAGADFINFSVFRKQAEVMEQYLKKGDPVLLVGAWTTGSYTNKDGAKVYTNVLNVSRIEFVPKNGGQDAAQQGAPQTAPQQAAPQQAPQQAAPQQGAPQPQAPADDGFMPFPEDMADELPFGFGEGLPFN